MKRREFITLVGGAAAWPLVSRAQNSRVRRVGMLMNLSADDIEATARIVAFVQELQRLGWTVGHNLQIEYRWGAGDADKFRKYATELAVLAPDVIVTSGAGTVAALLQATSSVPIVFALVADPIGAGFVDSLAQPGRNATGFTALEYSLGGKWLELLKEIAPNVTRPAVIRDPTDSAGIGLFSAVQSAATSAGVELTAVNVRNVDAMARALGAFASRGPNGGLILRDANWPEWYAEYMAAEQGGKALPL